MNQTGTFVAGLLSKTSGAVGGFAAERLLESHPNLAHSFGPDAFSLWKTWFTERIDELEASISSGSPDVFATQLQWSVTLFGVRGVSSDDLRSALLCLREVLADALPESARETVGTYFVHALQQYERDGEVEVAGRLTPDTPSKKLALKYLVALLEGDRRRAADLLLQAAATGHRASELYVDVITPALEEVGRMWMTGEVSIADEHFITAAARETIAELRANYTRQSPHGKSVLAAGVAGNQHDVGLQMVADLFEIAGWRAINLGANVPVGEIVDAAASFSVDVVVLSAALTRHLPTVRKTILAVRERCGSDVRILVGGGAFQAAPELGEQFGADAFTNTAVEACELANRLVGLPAVTI
jgi:methanogenic corrinoid protein MtbC1